MVRILDYTKQQHSERNQQFGSLGYWGALASLAYPFLLYATFEAVGPHISRTISRYIPLSLLLVCVSSILFGLFAVRADRLKRFVGLGAAALAVPANLVLFLMSARV